MLKLALIKLGLVGRGRRAGGGPAPGTADFSSPTNSGLLAALMEDI